MKRIAFLSNSVTNALDKYFRTYATDHLELGNVIPTLYSSIEADYLVIILDHSYYFDNFIDKESFERLQLLEDAILAFRKKNQNTKILITNIIYVFPEVCIGSQFDNRYELMKINLKIESFSNKCSDLAILDFYNISMKLGFDAIYNLKNKFLFQFPYTKESTKLLVDEIYVKLQILNSPRKKVLAIDADNTLWGGIIGEDGLKGIHIDENYPGIAYKYFQNYIKYLKKTGILLALISKNNYADIEEVFRVKKMPLDWDDFIIKKINWSPKSQNIRQAAKELNLSLESFVFIDDSSFEINEVQNNLKLVDSYQLNEHNPLENLKVIENISGLKTLTITEEDQAKDHMYQKEMERGQAMTEFHSVEKFLKSLNIKIDYNINSRENLSRITQLINKTNQFNLTTKRYTQSEVDSLMDCAQVFDFRVEDRFGDMGIVGVVIVNNDEIDTFLLSCRVLGRKIEGKMLQIVQRNTNNVELKASYVESEKNAQVENFYESMGCTMFHSGQQRKEYVLKDKIKNVSFIKEERD
jgi:FkbH-like protein